MSIFKYQCVLVGQQGLPITPILITLLRLHPRPRGDEGGLALEFYKRIMAVPSHSTETTFTFAAIPPFLPGAHACQSRPAQARSHRSAQSLVTE